MTDRRLASSPERGAQDQGSPHAPQPLGPQDAEREREILRQASVALSGRVVTLWEVAAPHEFIPQCSSVTDPPYHATVLDVEHTLMRWKTPLAPGGRWVGCRLNEHDWCVAPVRREPAAPPPGGVERRSRERMTLELAGLCVGVTLDPERPRSGATEPDHGLVSGVAGLADPVAVALASLKLSTERIEAEGHLDASFRAMVLDELAAVVGGLELAKQRAASLEARMQGLGGQPFDPAEIAQASVVLERPAARRRGVVLHLVGATSGATVTGDAYALSYALRSLIRCAVGRSRTDAAPVVVRLEEFAAGVRVAVEEGAAPDPASVDPSIAVGGTRRGVPELPLLRRLIQDSCGGRIELRPLPHGGRAAEIVLSRPPAHPGPVGTAN